MATGKQTLPRQPAVRSCGAQTAQTHDWTLYVGCVRSRTLTAAGGDEARSLRGNNCFRAPSEPATTTTTTTIMCSSRTLQWSHCITANELLPGGNEQQHSILHGYDPLDTEGHC